jgi:hypothetical protein
MKGNLHLQFNHAIDFTQKFLQMGLNEPTLVTTPICFGWKAIHPSRPTTYNNFILGEFYNLKKKKKNLIKLVLQTYQPHLGPTTPILFPLLTLLVGPTFQHQVFPRTTFIVPFLAPSFIPM